MYMSTSVTLDEFLNRDGDHINQVVYKVDGNFNGNITGDNVTVILMGDGNINGNINAKNGEVFINKGNVVGDINADTVLMPDKQGEKKNVYYARGHMLVKCPNCKELYRQGILITKDTKNSVVVKIDAEENAKDVFDRSRLSSVTCYECTHCQHGLETATCKLTNKVIRRWTPCENFEREYR